MNPQVIKLTATITNLMKKLSKAYLTGKIGTSGASLSSYPTRWSIVRAKVKKNLLWITFKIPSNIQLLRSYS